MQWLDIKFATDIGEAKRVLKLVYWRVSGFSDIISG